MITHNQLSVTIRLNKKKKIQKPLLFGCPQKSAVCRKLYIMKPKKPNSARRRVAKLTVKVKLMRNVILLRGFIGYIPGIGHSLQEFANVLYRGGKVRDLPSVRYKLLRGVLDFSSLNTRRKGRSKYGTIWWWRVKKNKHLLKENKILKLTAHKNSLVTVIFDLFSKLKLLLIYKVYNKKLIKKKVVIIFFLSKKKKISYFF